jgi:hypothetical protein
MRKDRIYYSVLNGGIGSLLGLMTVIFWQGLHVTLPLSHMVVFASTLIVVFYFLSLKIIGSNSAVKISLWSWLIFIIAVTVFEIGSHYIRYQDYEIIPQMSKAEFYCIDIQPILATALFTWPAFLLTAQIYKRLSGKLS